MKNRNKGSGGDVKVQMNRRPDAHFFGFVVLIVIWGLIGQFLISNKSAAQVEEFGRFRIYIAAISSLWLLFAYAAAGLHRRGVSVRLVIDPLPLDARCLRMYALIAVGIFLAWGSFSGVL